jgi:rod shape determining protein RodA
MLFVSGARLKYLIIIVLISILMLPLGWFFLKDYQKTRILVFLNPNIDPLGSGYTIIQSKIAIGSGELWGQGFLGGTQTRLKFLPERHTDFIFSVIGEEWGFIGALFVLIIFLIIFKRGLNIAEEAFDSYGKLVALGIVFMIFSHVLINTGMAVGVMPITGLPLPFLSYGGSAMFTMMIFVGILQSIYANRFLYS